VLCPTQARRSAISNRKSRDPQRYKPVHHGSRHLDRKTSRNRKPQQNFSKRRALNGLFQATPKTPLSPNHYFRKDHRNTIPAPTKKLFWWSFTAFAIRVK
jgi:hypothetical protein